MNIFTMYSMKKQITVTAFVLVLLFLTLYKLFPKDNFDSYQKCIRVYETESFNHREAFVLETLCLADNYDFDTLCQVYPSLDIEEAISTYLRTCLEMESPSFRSKDIHLQRFETDQLKIYKGVQFDFTESGTLLPPAFSVRFLGDLDSTGNHLTGVIEKLSEGQFKKGYASDRLTGGVNIYIELTNLEVSCHITQEPTFYELEWKISNEDRPSSYYREIANREFNTIGEVATYLQDFPFGLRSWEKGDKGK